MKFGFRWMEGDSWGGVGGEVLDFELVVFFFSGVFEEGSVSERRW